ncbi:hypothetical protein FLAN108750_07770 [Flavobacterium antarcticum]|uniref:tetratricopeptide repeat protein n=1 Tax=Flavobacterium antarcticum TaxID=271155 RepID=UPI0003B473DD|nr:hypothetical protein [Flavobacterium antarcticum]
MKIIFTILFLALCNLSMSQNFQQEFGEAFRANDTLEQLKILNSWEKSSPKNPELFTSFYNYYFRLAKKEVVSLTKQQPDGESFALRDSLNQTAGYMGSKIYYDANNLRNAFLKIDKGITLHPNRLDMRFGKIYALGTVENWEEFTNEIINTVNYSKTNSNKWLWTNNEEKQDGKGFMLSSIQSYQLQLYNTEDDALLSNMQRIASSILAIYPDNIESMSNLSITYFLTKQYDKGIEILLKAEKTNPKDYIVLANIAHGYNLIGNKAKAIEYYEKTILHGNDDTKAFAREKIQLLKK